MAIEDMVKNLTRDVEAGAKAFGKGALDAGAKGTGFLAGAVGYRTGLGAVAKGLATGEDVGVLEAAAMSSAHSGLLYGAGAAASKMVKYNAEGGIFDRYKISGFGKAVGVGFLGVSAVQQLADWDKQRHMGVVAPGVQEAPQATYDYDGITPQNTGADGNLVFALNKLRGGR